MRTTIEVNVNDSIEFHDRELNMIDILSLGHNVAYLDKAIDIYLSLPEESRKNIIEELPWTKLSKDYFIREFIGAVFNETDKTNEG
jgi:hypothetical protein